MQEIVKFKQEIVIPNIYIYIYTANCINFDKPIHIIKKTCMGESATMNTLINLNTLGWPKNVLKNT